MHFSTLIRAKCPAQLEVYDVIRHWGYQEMRTVGAVRQNHATTMTLTSTQSLRLSLSQEASAQKQDWAIL
jgi:hypothetical protein